MVVDTLAVIVLQLTGRIEALLAQPTSERILVAMAGVPGSGKSTVSQALLAELSARNIHNVAIVPMDGFHFSKAVLSTFPDPELAFKRRGAPFTFDAEAFVKLVKAIKTAPVTSINETEQFLSAPNFDHAIKDPVQAAIPISSRNRLIIIEGNYTLLDQKPWKEIAQFCEEKWFLDVEKEVVKERLAQRHLLAGIETSAIAAVKRAEENDLPNGDLIRSLLIKPDVIIKN
ncbi:Nn.00g105550.m01.CDS01 [Neocucurbitaria sp. VM-36]